MFRKKLLLNNKKGITLIALIVTIIILLILAGVALNFVLGENGILRHAEFAKEKYENKAQIEQNELAQIDDYISNGRDTITISKEEYDMLKNANSYSTDEKKIGTWIDGKPLYRRVFLAGTMNGASNSILLSPYNIEELTYLYARMNSANGDSSGDKFLGAGPAPHNTSTNAYHAFYYNASDHSIRSWGGNDVVEYDYIVIEYTKTTDTATNN